MRPYCSPRLVTVEWKLFESREVKPGNGSCLTVAWGGQTSCYAFPCRLWKQWKCLTSETPESKGLCIKEKRKNKNHMFCEWYKNMIFGYITSAVGRIKWNEANKKHSA